MGGDPAAPTANQAGTCVPIAQDQATKAPDDWQDSYSAYLGESLSTTRGFTATYTRSLGNVDFKSITAWRESSVSSDFEQSASALELIHIDINKQGYDTTSQEFQFSYLDVYRIRKTLTKVEMFETLKTGTGFYSAS